MVSRPSSRDGPESQPEPMLAHFGTLSVGSKTAVCSPPPPSLVTVNEIVVLCVNDPEVPVTVILVVPVVAVPEAVSVNVEVTFPLAGGVTGFGENAAVTPLGRPDALNVVAELNPATLVI